MRVVNSTILSILFTTSSIIASPQLSQTLKSGSHQGQIFKPKSVIATQCESKPQFLIEQKFPASLSLDSLSHVVLVGKKIEYFVETQHGQAYLTQDFTKKSSRQETHVVCGQIKNDLSLGLQIPTLIDNSREQNIGNSFWQIQITSKNNELTSLSYKTSALTNIKNIERFTADQKLEYKIYQKSSSEIEVVYKKEVDGNTQHISITYDLF